MSPALPSYLQPLSHGVYSIDTGFHREAFDACYLVVEHGHAAFIDTGTNFSVPRLLGALEALGLGVDAVDWAIPTHVHLDHAGGAGLLMRSLPRARVLVHPRGARHLVDPSALWNSATAVYGTEEMLRSYGALVPVAAERVDVSHDGMHITLAGRPLQLMHTPGHAKHHHCIWDEASHGWFTGDTFGLSYREFDTAQGAWIVPTSTPVQFEPEVLRGSIQRMLAAQPAWMYLTHYGRVGDVQRLGRLLPGLLDEMVALGLRVRAWPHAERHQALKAEQLQIFTRSLREHDCGLAAERIVELLAMDLELNAQGMGIWLDRKPS